MSIRCYVGGGGGERGLVDPLIRVKHPYAISSYRGYNKGIRRRNLLDRGRGMGEDSSGYQKKISHTHVRLVKNTSRFTPIL
jgi:hypothetical protein